MSVSASRRRGDGNVRVTLVSTSVKGRRRNRLEGLLRARPGKHVVFVRYTPQHEVGFEWVFNSAEIDAQNVMWANDRGAENHRLLAYYPDRTFWVLDADVAPLAVRPYPR